MGEKNPPYAGIATTDNVQLIQIGRDLSFQEKYVNEKLVTQYYVFNDPNLRRVD